MADDECGTDTPAVFQVVVQLPFRYGSTKGEAFDSWLHCRVTAFMSAACFEEPRLFLKVGDPVSGFLECTHSKKHFGAQLTGWPRTLATEWKTISPASFPLAFELNGDVIAALPRTKRGLLITETLFWDTSWAG